jgi:hypothetical protein
MIPVESRGDSTNWYYPTVLHGFKEYCTRNEENNHVPLIFHQNDLPFNIYRYQEYPDSTNYWDGPRPDFIVDWESAIEGAINEAENNGEWNWFNNQVVQISRDDIDEVSQGIIIEWVDGPYGGGLAYTHTLARHEDATPYLWRIELDYSLSEGNWSADAVVRREIGRMMNFYDAVPHMTPGYVMRHESIGWPNYHPQELGIFELKYDIMDYGNSTGQYDHSLAAPKMDWYLTAPEGVEVNYGFDENKE